MTQYFHKLFFTFSKKKLDIYIIFIYPINVTCGTANSMGRKVNVRCSYWKVGRKFEGLENWIDESSRELNGVISILIDWSCNFKNAIWKLAGSTKLFCDMTSCFENLTCGLIIASCYVKNSMSNVKHLTKLNVNSIVFFENLTHYHSNITCDFTSSIKKI